MDERQESALRVQRLVIKTDPETIRKMTQAYESLQRVAEQNELHQREAGQRIEDERRARLTCSVS